MHPSKKLLNTVDLESVIRVECIMCPEAQLEEGRRNYLDHIETEIVEPEEPKIVELLTCFNNMCKQAIVEPDEMKRKCEGCGKKAGLQKTVEIGKLSQYVGVVVNKSNPKTQVNYPPSLHLDKFIRSRSLQPGTLASLDLLALVNTNEETSSVLLRHSDPHHWTKLTIGAEAETAAVSFTDPEEATSDAGVTFALYRRDI